jgi:hypothetical protein
MIHLRLSLRFVMIHLRISHGLSLRFVRFVRFVTGLLDAPVVEAADPERGAPARLPASPAAAFSGQQS